MAVKSLHQFFYFHSKYLNSMKCREISMGPSIHIIQCKSYQNFKWLELLRVQECDHLIDLARPRLAKSTVVDANTGKARVPTTS
jgi:hypothetical protein